MKMKPARSAALLSGLGLGALLLLPGAAFAQVTEPSADEAVWGNSQADPFGEGGASSLMDLLQRGQVGPNQSRAEFLEKQNENLNDAAAAFRARQREALNTAPEPAQPGAEPGLAEPDPQLQSQGLDSSPRRALW